jgi:polar amino acid transport system ATP-binding protein
MISIRHLKKVFPNATPLLDVNAEIGRGEVVSIIGPSGTGKSTFLRCINRLEDPTAGEILIDGKSITAPSADVPSLRRKMGMVFQSFNLFNHLTVLENIMVAQVDLLHRSKKEAYEKAMELLHRVGLADKALNLPEELSGGQKQRAAIARTLAMDPEIVLFDEPTSALDPTMVGEVLAVIRNLSKQGLTMLIVTDEMKFARDISTRIFYMDEGVIYEEGTPEQIFEHPQKEKTRQFIRRLKVFEEKFSGGSMDYVGVVNRLHNFAEKNQISGKMSRNMLYVFEEIVAQSLVLKIADTEEICMVMEYSGENEGLVAKIEYGGKSLNPLDDIDDVSRRVVELATSDVKHEYTDGKNCMKVHIR